MIRGKGWKGRLYALVNRPILVSQIFASVGGAVVMIIGAANMDISSFAIFSLLNLASNTLLGLVRVSVFQPALIAHRRDKNAITPLRYATVAVLCGVIGFFLLSFLIGRADLATTSLVAISVGLPILQEWLRQRCVIEGRRWLTAIGDGARLAAFPALVLMLGVPSPNLFQAMFHGSAMLSIVVMLPGLRRLHEWTPFRSYSRGALSQALDYAVGTLNSIVPLFILGALGGSAFIGGFRLAQTFLGPLNLLFAASRTTLLADGATKDSHRHDHDLIRHGSKLAAQLGLLAAGVVAVIIGGVWLFKVELSGVTNSALLFGLIGVGLVSATSGWSGIHTIIMRMFGKNGIVTAGRTILVIFSWAGFFLGYVLGGVDLSLILGFAVSAVLYPVVFVLPARRTYRRMLEGKAL